MNELFFPEEFVVIGTSLVLHKNKVTNDEINDYMRKFNFPIEYSDDEYKFCKYKNNMWEVNNLPPLHPYIHSILTKL